MKHFRWINLFLTILSALLLGSILLLYSLRELVTFERLFYYEINGMSFYVYMIVAFLILSLVVSIMLSYGLRYTNRYLLEKLQWLILGKYDHPIFSQETIHYTIFSSHADVLSEQLNSISRKMQMLNDDLKQWRANNVSVSLVEKEKILLEERHRIARELHDSVSQELFAATMLLSSVKEIASATDGVLHKQIYLIDQTVTQAQTEMRSLLMQLRPIMLEGRTLKQGIELILSDLQTKVNLMVSADLQEVVIESVVEDQLFRVIQEVISNILRHARATRVECYMKQQEDELVVRIIDNGIGFDVDKEYAGYGINNIKERIVSLGGTVQFISVLNQGTIVEIKIRQ